MNVLSLFDGMSCGMLALERAGIKVDNYFASEIDKYAIQVSKSNYPNIIQLGDVTNWREWDLPNIDLVIGGSPCQGFSFAGKQLNFDDPRSKLFFEMIDIIEHFKPKYFLLENVKMKKPYEEVITNYMGVKPLEINSSLFSAQNRIRLYWTNINIKQLPSDKNIKLLDVMDWHEPNEWEKKIKTDIRPEKYLKVSKEFKIKKNQEKASCLTGGANSGGNHSDMDLIIDKEGNVRRYSVLECERLQTLPEGYTEGVSNSQRYKMIGNGWTVDVISHIFKGLK